MDNEVIMALKTRRSVRSYKPDQITDDELKTVLEAGTWAPTAMGYQDPWIVAVQNPALLKKISRMNAEVWGRDIDPFYGAPAMLIVLAKKDEPNHVYDGSLVMGNLMLAAHDLGLGSCWIHRARQECETEEGRQILADLGIEGEWEGIGHCALGYIDGENPAPLPRKPNRVFYIE